MPVGRLREEAAPAAAAHSATLRIRLLLPATCTPVQAPHSPQLLIRAMAPAAYFEQRKSVDVWSFIKSPYGLMIGFMLFFIVIMPMLKVDPEEYQEAMASLRGQPAPAQGQAQLQQGGAQRRPVAGAAQQRIRDR